jgi:hypothetical protein
MALSCRPSNELSALDSGPLTTRQPARPQDHEWPPSPGWPAPLSVGRVCAGPLALHIASTVCGCGPSTASPSDSGPKPLGPFKRVSSILAPGPLATRQPPQGGSPSRPRALSRVARSAFGRSRLCRPVGLAHRLDRVRLRRPTHLALGPGIVKTTGHGKVPGPGLALAPGLTPGLAPAPTVRPHLRRSPRPPRHLQGCPRCEPNQDLGLHTYCSNCTI